MADTEDSKHGIEMSASPPDSTNEAPNEPRAPKDRTCPFCNQAFTSSSLGRHLDLYIKPKNPKPPDGLHDINEIKRMRGGITRRQPRTSLRQEQNERRSRRKDSVGWASGSTKKLVDPEVQTVDNSPIETPRNVDDGRLHTWLNAANWQATGVINDLPARASSRNVDKPPSGQTQPVQEIRRDAFGDRGTRPEYAVEDLGRLQESAEVGRAAEMALREVLGSLEAAKSRSKPREVFDFDYFSLAFPGLCLAMLPSPPTLFSSTPFPVAHTWSLSPPGDKQNAALVRLLHERIVAVRDGVPDNVPESVAFGYRVHLDGAYEHWRGLSETEQSATWNLEVCRAFVREKEKKQHLENKLDIAEQRIRHLETEYDRLSRCQLPREYLLHPPNTIPISSPIAREMKSTNLSSGVAEVDYDAEALLNKWKAEVKAVSRPIKLPPLRPHYVESTRSQLKEAMVMNGSVFGVNGAMPRDAESSSRTNYPHEADELPRNPGGTMGLDEDAEVEEVRAHADGDGADAANNHGQLSRLRSSRKLLHASSSDGGFNANGKRIREPSPANGRSPGPRMYKEQAK